MTESQIVTTICEYLELKKYFFWRQNNTAIYDGKRKTYRAMPKYAKRGVADLLIIIDGQAVFLEVKRPKCYLSEYQKKFKEDLLKYGGSDKYYLVRSVKDVIKLGF